MWCSQSTSWPLRRTRVVVVSGHPAAGRAEASGRRPRKFRPTTTSAGNSPAWSVTFHARDGTSGDQIIETLTAAGTPPPKTWPATLHLLAVAARARISARFFSPLPPRKFHGGVLGGRPCAGRSLSRLWEDEEDDDEGTAMTCWLAARQAVSIIYYAADRVVSVSGVSENPSQTHVP